MFLNIFLDIMSVNIAPKPYTGVHGPYKIPLEKWPDTIKVNIPSTIKPKMEYIKKQLSKYILITIISMYFLIVFKH